MVDIVVTDGYFNSNVMDVLGKGSTLGSDFMITKETWHFEAIVSSLRSAKIITIPFTTIKMLA